MFLILQFAFLLKQREIKRKRRKTFQLRNMIPDLSIYRNREMWVYRRRIWWCGSWEAGQGRWPDVSYPLLIWRCSSLLLTNFSGGIDCCQTDPPTKLIMDPASWTLSKLLGFQLFSLLLRISLLLFPSLLISCFSYFPNSLFLFPFST